MPFFTRPALVPPAVGLAWALSLVLFVAGCAAQPAPSPQAAAPMGQTSTGQVAAIRTMLVAGPQAANAGGVNAVLAALNQPVLGSSTLASPAQGSEIVIIKPDGNAISTAAMNPPPLTPGDQVVLIEGASTSLVRR